MSPPSPLGFTPMFVVSQKTLFTILFHHLDDCEGETEPGGERPELNDGLHL